MAKILIIEDEAAIRRVLGKILSEESDTYTVEDAEDGLAGIEKIKNEDYDLGEDRGRRARVQDPAGCSRGRHRHHPQPQELDLHASRRLARGGGARDEEGPRRREGIRHRRARRARDPQPEPRDREPLRQG